MIDYLDLSDGTRMQLSDGTELLMLTAYPLPAGVVTATFSVAPPTMTFRVSAPSMTFSVENE